MSVRFHNGKPVADGRYTGALRTGRKRRHYLQRVHESGPNARYMNARGSQGRTRHRVLPMTDPYIGYPSGVSGASGVGVAPVGLASGLLQKDAALVDDASKYVEAARFWLEKGSVKEAEIQVRRLTGLSSLVAGTRARAEIANSVGVVEAAVAHVRQDTTASWDPNIRIKRDYNVELEGSPAAKQAVRQLAVRGCVLERARGNAE